MDLDDVRYYLSEIREDAIEEGSESRFIAVDYAMRLVEEKIEESREREQKWRDEHELKQKNDA